MHTGIGSAVASCADCATRTAAVKKAVISYMDLFVVAISARGEQGELTVAGRDGYGNAAAKLDPLGVHVIRIQTCGAILKCINVMKVPRIPDIKQYNRLRRSLGISALNSSA